MAIDSYYSIAYLAIFLPAVVIAYTVFPKKARWFVLLISSGIFFWSMSGKLLIWLIVSIFSIHYGGIYLSLLQKERDGKMARAKAQQGGPSKKEIRKLYQKKQLAVAAAVALFNVGILVFLKYTPFFGANMNRFLAWIKAPFSLNIPSFVVPIGISFYTLQAVAYVMDVYREKFPAERNIFRLALYMSFFPQLMEGPICRYPDTSGALWQGERIQFENLVSGMQRIAFGMMKKLVIADRLNLFIKNVFTNYNQYDGGITALAAVLYTCQLYMDFSGTMDIVLGTGEIFGVILPENFRQPFFSKSISEFWQRWHITLGAWFKDYIFYPLSMTGPMKKLTSHGRKRLGNHYGPLTAGACGLFCVWLLNGLWHGAGWHYIFFGMYHFALILAGSLWEPAAAAICRLLHIRRTSVPWKGVQIARTAVLVCIGELFFRAHGLRAGLFMFFNIIWGFSLSSFGDGTVFNVGMDKKDFLIAFIGVLIVLVNSIMKEKGTRPRKWLADRPVVFRWALCYGLILFVVIFGAYGAGYVPLDPIYANF